MRAFLFANLLICTLSESGRERENGPCLERKSKRRMNDQKGKTQSRIIGDISTRPKSISRRAIIKGGATVMPAILTLHSGAVLARSSNMISASSPDTTDGMGRTLCVNKSSVVYADDHSEIYDLGEPPYAECNVIRGPTEVQFYESKDKSTPIRPGAMCEKGGQFWSKPDGGGAWVASDLPQGFVASAGAMTSIASYVKDNLI